MYNDSRRLHAHCILYTVAAVLTVYLFYTAMQAYIWAGERGYPEAQFQLAQLYKQGLFVTADAEKCKEWLEKAVSRGYAVAMNELALMLLLEVSSACLKNHSTA